MSQSRPQPEKLNVFVDEWRDCLRAHYQHAVRQNDQTALKTLVPVLQEKIGFSEDELRQLYVEATMRAEDIDFVPDLDVIDGMLSQPQNQNPPVTETPAFQPHPLECQCPDCIKINLVPHDDQGQPLDAEQLAELEEREAYERQKRDANAPKQLSLF